MNIKIGLPFTPAKIISDKLLIGSEIVISGSGMSAPRQAYTLDKFNLENKFICVDTNYSKDTCINTNHIIEVVPVKIIKLVVKNLGNQNKNFETKTYYIKLNISDTYTIDHNNYDKELSKRVIDFYE